MQSNSSRFCGHSPSQPTALDLAVLREDAEMVLNVTWATPLNESCVGSLRYAITVSVGRAPPFVSVMLSPDMVATIAGRVVPLAPISVVLPANVNTTSILVLGVAALTDVGSSATVSELCIQCFKDDIFLVSHRVDAQ